MTIESPEQAGLVSNAEVPSPPVGSDSIPYIPGPPQFGQPEPPVAPRGSRPNKKSKAGLIVALAAAGMIVLCGGVVALAAVTHPIARPSAAPTFHSAFGANPTVTAGPQPVASVAPPPSPAAPAGPQGIFDDGDWVVGTDILPGTYSATVPLDSTNCYWERLHGFSGQMDDIIANGNVVPGKKVIVAVSARTKASTQRAAEPGQGRAS